MSARPRGEVELAGLSLRSPVIAASGTVGVGYDAEGFDFSRVGAVVLKTVTREPREGNLSPRVWETPSGMLNSIGLENPGLERLVEHLPEALSVGCPVFASVAADAVEGYAQLCEALEGKGLAGVELNLSCPNVEREGMAFGREAGVVAGVVRACRGSTSLPLVAKLTPNVTDIVAIGRAAEGAGADAVCAVNTILGMGVELRSRRLFRGGLSGPAVKPVALRMVRDLSKALSIPVVGCGGIMTGTDVAEFLLAGAAAVQAGTANLVEPNACARIAEEFERFLKEEGTTAKELIGGGQEWRR